MTLFKAKEISNGKKCKINMINKLKKTHAINATNLNNICTNELTHKQKQIYAKRIQIYSISK